MKRSIGWLACSLCLALCLAAGCGEPKAARPVEPGFHVKQLENNSYLFEANPKAADKADIQAFLHELNNLMQANPKMEVRSVVPMRAGTYQAGGRDSSTRDYYSILVFTAPKGEPRQPKDKP